MNDYELIVIGGGSAGLAAACAAWDAGLRRVLVLERDGVLGGILNQCIHNGFGLTQFKEELTGPEYAGRFIDRLAQTGVEVRCDTMVLQLTADRQVICSSPKGYEVLHAQSVVLAMGCRERTRGAIQTPGERPAGIFTAGTAQRYLNIEGYMVGRRIVVLGSGDIGLIMARRMTLEGAEVLACVEVMPTSSGLTRNIVQCLNDFNIPLYLSHTVTDIRGHNRVEQVVVSEVDSRRQPIPGTEMVFDCDTLLLSVGLIPENELSRMAGIEMDSRTSGAVVYENNETSIPGVFACGNVLHVHDLVDNVTAESLRAGKSAAEYVLHPNADCSVTLPVTSGNGVSYVVPQRVRPARVERAVNMFFRVRQSMGAARILVRQAEKTIAQFKRERMAPGEMEHIVIPKQLLPTEGEGLTISVEEVME